MAELLHALGIDWKLLLAQVVNFAILAFVLAKFVYRPIVSLLEARRNKIKQDEEKSREMDRKLEEIKALEAKTLADARIAGTKIVQDAEASAKKLKEEITIEAHKEAEKLVEDGKRKLGEEERRIKESMKGEIASLIALSIERTIGDAMDKESERKLAEKAFDTASRVK